jgi:hypothetical protein
MTRWVRRATVPRRRADVPQRSSARTDDCDIAWGSSSICVHVSIWHSDETFPLIIHVEHSAMDAWTRHSGPGS